MTTTTPPPMLDQVPNPYEVVIDSVDMKMKIPDTSKPVWHGDYHGGKLSIYKAEVLEGGYPNSDTYVSVYVNPEEKSFIVSASYEKGILMEEVASHLIANVIITYSSMKDPHSVTSATSDTSSQTVMPAVTHQAPPTLQ